MMDQLIIGNKASYDDFEASLYSRKIYNPEKKSIKDTVPFSNQTYDFSAINGEVYWNERQLEYVFEIWADSPEELEAKKQRFFDWIMNVMNEEIHDPFIPDYHFIGTYDSSDPEDAEDIEKTTITVKFAAYPYKLANEKTVLTFNVSASAETSLVITNDSSHRVQPTITCDDDATLSIDGKTFVLSKGTYTYDGLMLKAGTNAVKVKNSASDGAIIFEFVKEVR